VLYNNLATDTECNYQQMNSLNKEDVVKFKQVDKINAEFIA